MNDEPLKVGDAVILGCPSNRYYIPHWTEFPKGSKGVILAVEQDEHLSSRAYRVCYLYEVQNAKGQTGWFTDLDIEADA